MSDLRGKPCSRSYQDAGGQHALMILAKHQGIVVRLYPQPQRGRLPSVSGAAVVRGRWGKHRPLAACLGVVQAVTLHPSGALTPLRHAAEPQKARSLTQVLSHDPRELYEAAPY